MTDEFLRWEISCEKYAKQENKVKIENLMREIKEANLKISNVINSIEYEAFESAMNPPEPHNGQAYLQKDYKTGQTWVICPYCGKRQFPLTEGAHISKQKFKCKGSNCHEIFEVNV